MRVPSSPGPVPLSAPRFLRGIFGALAIAFATSGATAADLVRLHDATGAGLTNHPLQLGHAFLPGEVADTPAVFADGVPLATQAEVTHRWADGSARFAAISTVVPAVPAGGTVQLGFGSAAASASTATTTVADLLAAFPDFDARVTFTQGAATHTASARAMLLAGHAEWLARGPVRCELRVADHASRSQDFGFDGYRPLRPTFYVAFWPALGKVRVRVVVENPNLDALKEVTYDVSIALGLAAPATVYAKSGVTHYFGTRWTKTFWSGGAPATQVDVQTDLAHLAATGFVPNYDPANTPPAGELDWQWTYWQTKARDLYDYGYWTPYMPSTGGRGDIGPIPAWVELWLSTGDWRAREIALENSDLAAAWPLHFREHDATKTWDRDATVSAAGRPLSLNVHPTLWFPDNNGNYADMVAGAARHPSWVPDGAHQPDPFSVPYLLTGDRFYLEAMQLWTGAQSLAYAPNLYGRGLSGYGGIQDQVRGNAWVIRNRVLAAQLSPDGSVERRYFGQLLDDALALWQGQRGVADPYFDSHPNRIWAATNYAFTWSPLRYWNQIDPYNHEASPWMDWYFMAELGFVRDLGAPTDRLLAEYGKLFIAEFNTPGYDPRYVAAYRHLQADDAHQWFATWTDELAYNLANNAANMTAAIASFEGTGDAAFAIQAATAGAYLTGYPGGATAWAWLKPRVHDTMANDLKTWDRRRWKILPHTTPPPAPTTYERWRAAQSWGAANQTETADPDGDGRSNLLEYALGSSPVAADAALPVVTAGGELTLTYPLDPTKTDLAYLPEVSTDTVAWTAAPATLTSQVVWQQTWTARTPVGVPTKTLRLRVARTVTTTTTSGTSPAITTSAPTTGAVGTAYSYDVNANGSPAPTFTLTAAPSGMTINSTTGVIAWTPSAGGAFGVTVRATNGTSSDALQSFVITVAAPGVAPAISTAPVAQTVRAGGGATFTVSATGTGPLSYQWRRNGAAIAGANSATLTLPATVRTDAGNYDVVVSNGVGSVISSAAALQLDYRLLRALAARARVAGGSDVLVAGFVVGGTEPKRLLVRAVGPTLATYGIGAPVPRPHLAVFAGTTEIAANEVWGTNSNAAEIRAAATALGAAALPDGSLDAAVLQTFAPGVYTAQVKGAGVALVEVYDLDGSGRDAPLKALSSRAWVGAGVEILIPSLVVEGGGPKRVLVRAIGPGLAAYGVPGVLAAPRLEVHRMGVSAPVASNQGWGTAADPAAITAAGAALGAFPLAAGSADCALLLDLDPGAYTFHVNGVGDTTGTALVEIYEAD